MDIKLEIKIFEYFESNKLYIFFVVKYQVIYHLLFIYLFINQYQNRPNISLER